MPGPKVLVVDDSWTEEQSRDIPIILISGKSTALDKRWGIQQGAELYLTKPFSKDELIASVRSLV